MFLQSIVALFPRGNLNIRFLPPYSPQLNPVELWISQLKGALRRSRPQPRTRPALKLRLYNTIATLAVTKPTLPLFKEMRYWLSKAAARQRFE